MPLDSADIATLSRLLDEALELRPDEREAWLAALPAADQPHAARLREMLAAQAEIGSAGPLSTLPKLGPDEATAHAGERVGPYRLIREIGQGGMGSVWLAERADGAYKRQVALKLPRLAWGAGLAQRMAREREIGMLLEHPNIARLYDAGVDERGRPFLALEFVDGQPIDVWCEAQALSVRDRLKLFVQVARAVAYAHGRLVVHRDLKPSNVLVTADGQAHLLDFGIAKLLLEAAPGESGLTQDQGRVLTPHYASPEQVAGEPITVASDIYSLGVLLYEVLTGVLPIAPRRSTLGAMEEAILQGDAPLASGRLKDRTTSKALRGDVDAILAMAMKREPARRYATADAMAMDVERFLQGETVIARPDSVGYRLRKALRRHWVGMSAATAVLVAVLSGAAVALLQVQRAAREAERSRLATAFVSELFALDSRQDASRIDDRRPVKEVFLDRGAALITARFDKQPDIQARLYGAVGQVYADMGAGALAVKYARRQVEILKELPVDDSERIRSRILLARALDADDKDADAEVEAHRAAELAQGNGELRGEALAVEGWIQINNGRSEQAKIASLEAERLLLAAHAPPSLGMSEFLMVQAILKRNDKKLDEALSLTQRATDNALAVQGPQSPFAVKLRIWMATHLLFGGRVPEARMMADAAIEAVRGSGGAGEVTAASKHAQFLYSLFSSGNINIEDAEAQLRRARSSLASRSSSVPPLVLAKLNLYAGAIRLRWGDLDGAANLLLPSARLIKDQASHQWLLRFVLLQEAQLQMSMGHHDEATALFKEMHELIRESGSTVGNSLKVYDALFAAENLVMQGRFDEADQLMAEATKFIDTARSTSEVQQAVQKISEMRSWNRLVQGDARAAILLIQDVNSLRLNVPNADHFQEKLKGEILCATGNAAEGSNVLTDVLKAMEVRVGPMNPELARLRAIAGQCMLTLGNRALAVTLARAARAAFVAQPDVSPYFKAPLSSLERMLGMRTV